MRKNKGIAIPLSYIALAIVILVIGSVVAYFYLSHLKLTTQVETSELAKQETRLLEKLSLILWYKSGNKGIAIISNDGEIPVYIKKIYADGIIKDISSNPIIINPHNKTEVETPYNNGQSLMVETSSGNLIKLVEKGFTITGTIWTTSLPTEITYTSYVPTTLTTTQTSISPTTITTTKSTTLTQTLTTTSPTTITQTLSTTQTLTSYIPTTYTTTYATTGTATITTTIPTTITTTKSTTQTITSYIPTTYTSIITTTKPTTITSYIPTTYTSTITTTIPTTITQTQTQTLTSTKSTTLTQTQTLTQTTTRTVVPTTITSSYLTTTTIPAIPIAHFRGDTWTINGLNAYKLDSSQSNIEKSNYVQTSDLAQTAFWINVWKRSSSGSETLIAGGYTARIFIYYNYREGYYSASWSHPAIYLDPSDSIVVRVYGANYGSKQLLAEFTTSQLGITYIPASTWTVYYYVRVSNSFSNGHWYSNYYFHWGTSSKDSRIENFVPTPITTTTYVPTTITTITDYLGSIFIGEKSPIFLMTLCIIVVSITIEIKERIKNGKQK
jgi:hypothetical protein